MPKVAFQPASSMTRTGQSVRRHGGNNATGADPGAVFLHRRQQADPFQLAHTVGGQEYAGADFAPARGLLVNGDVEAGREGVRREQAADAAADDCNRKPHVSALSFAAACSSVPVQRPFRCWFVQAILSCRSRQVAANT
jgi:hypothetical protein